MREPYRVIVWGTGKLGSALVRLIARSSEYSLVGAYTYSSDKDGRDVGEIVGIEPLGVAATTDRHAILELEAACVLYVPQDWGDWRGDQDILDLLSRGKNVVTALPYRYLKWRGQELVQQVTDAAEQGGTSFYAGGVNPDWVCERLVLLASGLCGEVSGVTVREHFRCDTIGAPMFHAAGFGKPIDDAPDPDPQDSMTWNYYAPSMMSVGERMGKPVGRVEVTSTRIPAPVDITTPYGVVATGTTALIRASAEAFVGDEVFFRVELNYYIGDAMRAEEAIADECWFVMIEGTPSVRLALDTRASLAHATDGLTDDPTPPGYYATAAPLLQAIPALVAAPPGISESFASEPHWKKDLRLGN